MVLARNGGSTAQCAAGDVGISVRVDQAGWCANLRHLLLYNTALRAARHRILDEGYRKEWFGLQGVKLSSLGKTVKVICICESHILTNPFRTYFRALTWMLVIGLLMMCSKLCPAQNQQESKKDGQINVNWLYGSYVPKDVPLEPLNTRRRFELYVRQTYTTWGIYVKTTLFAISDQSHNTYPQWGQSFSGFAKRWGTRQGQFIVQNSVASLGNGLVGWEPRYDRCHCNGLWLRTRHAIVRNFVTYDRTEKRLRPQLFPYVGAFTGSVVATTWQPGTPRWEVKGYQAVITQVPVGIGTNWLGEFAPEIVRILRRSKK